MSATKSFEKKVLHCVDARTYVRIVEKVSEKGYLSDGRMSLSSKTFENHPDYVFLVSARLCGERRHIHEFVQIEDKNLSESFKTLVSRDLEQAMTKDNYSSDSLVQEYQLSVVGANPTIITTSRTPYGSVLTVFIGAILSVILIEWGSLAKILIMLERWLQPSLSHSFSALFFFWSLWKRVSRVNTEP